MRPTATLAACAALWVCNTDPGWVGRGVGAGALAPGISMDGPGEPHRVVPVFLVPRDYAVPYERVVYHATVVRDVRSWYGRVLGGRTYAHEPLVVQVSRHTFAELSAQDFQAWWPLLQREFADYGWPWNRRSTIKLLFLTHGAGAWAGADSENGGIDSVSHAGRVDKGNRGGLAVIGDSSVGGVFAGVCPETHPGKSDSTVATAWWCSGSTYRGTVAHELGHTWGLPHPDAFRQGFRCADSTAYTIMQCHWEWGREKLLDYEVAHLRSLAFFAFDTMPAYALLPHVSPRSAGSVRRARLEAGDSLAWIDGRGGGTGYPWALVLDGAGARAEYPAGPAYEVLVFDVGIARGSAAGASVRVEVDRRPVALLAVHPGHGPQRVSVPTAGARSVGFRVVEGRGRVVLGNPRLYRGWPADKAHRGGSGTLRRHRRRLLSAPWSRRYILSR